MAIHVSKKTIYEISSFLTLEVISLSKNVLAQELKNNSSLFEFCMFIFMIGLPLNFFSICKAILI
jgi:hypothetical protein